MASRRKGGSMLVLVKDLWTIVSFVIEIIITLISFVGSGVVFLYQRFSSTTTKPSEITPSAEKSQTSLTKHSKKDDLFSPHFNRTSLSSSTAVLGDDKMKGPIQKNQLPNGCYVIGKDIPAGTYDFEALHGSGIMIKYLSETTQEDNYFQRIGLKDYDNQHLINVDCREGEVLKIPDNVVVSISRSNNVVLDL